MNEHEFEQRLRDQPMRRIPSQWRSDILAAAQTARPSHQAAPSSILHFLSSILWPSPYAWGGLAAAWVLIVLVNSSANCESGLVAAKSAPPSPQIMEAVREQQKMLAELIGQPEAPPAVIDRPQPRTIQPRSDRRTAIPTV